ncbi:MAG: histidine--tRNA ligase [Candidatus Pacebacteria bacterium]|nr:histidine--tRNA ligase [Candidatus Paceibacterota bacterium]
MRDITGETYYDMQGFFEKAQEIAEYYGFRPIKTPILEHTDLFLRGVGDGTDIVDKEIYAFQTKGKDRVALRPEGTAAVMRSYIQHGMQSLPQPIMLYYCEPMFRHDRPQKGRYRQHHQFGMEILGTPKPVADAIIIQTTVTILREVGAKNIFVSINSIGDKDSRNEYIKALKAYYRKHINDLPALDRERLNTNPLRILDSKEPKTIAINQDAPSSLDYLGNEAKKHFKQVLEYLEEADIPYELNKNLVRGLDYYSNTVFEIMETIIDEDGTERTLSITGGGRYDYLARTLGHKKDVPGVGVGIGIERVIESPWWNETRPRIVKKPKIFFIQLGFDARLRSLKVLEMLRKAKIPVQQSLSKDNLSGQLALAEKTEVPYTIIFGQKEAMDGTAIVRDMQSRSQKTVPLEELPAYIRSLK